MLESSEEALKIIGAWTPSLEVIRAGIRPRNQGFLRCPRDSNMQKGDNQPCHLTNSQVSVIQRVIPDQEHLHHLGTGENCELWDPTQTH